MSLLEKMPAKLQRHSFWEKSSFLKQNFQLQLIEFSFGVLN